MQIYSPDGLTLDGIGAGYDPPLIVVGLTPPQLTAAFQSFRNFVNQHTAQDSLSRAMFSRFINLANSSLNNSNDLYAAIRAGYDSFSGTNQSAQNKAAQFQYNLYLYIALHHFICWYLHTSVTDPPTSVAPPGVRDDRVLKSVIRNYVADRLAARAFQTDVTVDRSFFQTAAFTKGFETEGSLQEMVASDALGKVSANGSGSGSAYLRRAGKPLADAATALKVKREFIQAFRETIAEMINQEVRRILAKLNTPTTPTGQTLANGYGDYRQFGVGNGTGTKGMFREPSFGLLFFEYELNDLTNPGAPCATDRLNVPLIDERDPDGTEACLFYYGLDNNFTTDKASSPCAEIVGCDSGLKRPQPSVTFRALSQASHQLVWSKGVKANPNAIDVQAFGATALLANLRSSTTGDPEELMYILFKHYIAAGRPRRPPFRLTTDWLLIDNKYKKTLAEEAAELFDGQSSQMTALVAALAADSAFEVDAWIEGCGVGRKRDGAKPGENQLQRDRNRQADKPLPAKTAYDALRYAYGQVDWAKSRSGTGGWLFFQVYGFVSPLRCTMETHLTGAPLAALQALIKPYVPEDGQHRKSYNCALSALRALFLFEAMIRRIQAATGSGAQATRINDTLTDYLQNEAQVKILLPNDKYAARPALKWGDLAPFR